MLSPLKDKGLGEVDGLMQVEKILLENRKVEEIYFVTNDLKIIREATLMDIPVISYKNFVDMFNLKQKFSKLFYL